MAGRAFSLVTGLCAAALSAFWAPGSDAQTMYKCVDSQKRVTYSNITCEKQGLKDAGPVADRTTTMPFVPAQKTAPGSAPASRTEPAVTVPTKKDAEGGAGTSPQAKPASPVIEKLLK